MAESANAERGLGKVVSNYERRTNTNKRCQILTKFGMGNWMLCEASWANFSVQPCDTSTPMACIAWRLRLSLLQPLTLRLANQRAKRLLQLRFLLEKLKPHGEPGMTPLASFEVQSRWLGVIIESWLRLSPEDSQLSMFCASCTNRRA
jgi:hypothetical protein